MSAGIYSTKWFLQCFIDRVRRVEGVGVAPVLLNLNTCIHLLASSCFLTEVTLDVRLDPLKQTAQRLRDYCQF